MPFPLFFKSNAQMRHIEPTLSMSLASTSLLYVELIASTLSILVRCCMSIQNPISIELMWNFNAFDARMWQSQKQFEWATSWRSQKTVAVWISRIHLQSRIVQATVVDSSYPEGQLLLIYEQNNRVVAVKCAHNCNWLYSVSNKRIWIRRRRRRNGWKH